ncbi:MAG: DUF4245 domain-containing protein [Actinobacteria bacterium]|nr:DUF4245 domain-containing protein [Actinomycetota bacterium]
MAKTDRLSQSVGGMVLTIAAGLGVIGLIALFTFRPQQPEVRVVDYQAAVTAAEIQKPPFELAVPVPVPDGWQATSARYRPVAGNPDLATWNLGFFIPEEDFAGIAQSNATDGEFIRENTVSGERAGTQEINGVEWVRYRSEDDRRTSLVSESDGVTVIVTGTISDTALGELAASLQYR